MNNVIYLKTIFFVIFFFFNFRSYNAVTKRNTKNWVKIGETVLEFCALFIFLTTEKTKKNLLYLFVWITRYQYTYIYRLYQPWRRHRLQGAGLHQSPPPLLRYPLVSLSPSLTHLPSPSISRLLALACGCGSCAVKDKLFSQ